MNLHAMYAFVIESEMGIDFLSMVAGGLFVHLVLFS